MEKFILTAKEILPRVIQNNYSLVQFTVLNYLDKFLAFSLPLLILYLVKDITLYNNIEYIFSIASLGVVVIDLGLKSFFLYKYSSNFKNHYTYINQVKTYFHWLFLCYCLLGILLVILSQSTSYLHALTPFIIIRILLLFFVGFFSIYFRLIDKPEKVLYYNISINLLTICGIFIYYSFLGEADLTIFFLFPFIFLSSLFIYSLKKNQWNQLKNLLAFLKQSLNYSWPLILNVLVITVINNYGKIYAFNNFSENEMYNFSYVLRFAMIIQMAHVSVVAFYSKEIFIDLKTTLNLKIYKIYNFFIIIAVGMMFMVLLMINKLDIIPQIPINILVFLILSYVFIWCQQAYFEQYLNKLNKNKYLLFFSILGSSVFLLMLFLKKDLSINYIAFSMLMSSLINFTIILAYLKKIKLI